MVIFFFKDEEFDGLYVRRMATAANDLWTLCSKSKARFKCERFQMRSPPTD